MKGYQRCISLLAALCLTVSAHAVQIQHPQQSTPQESRQEETVPGTIPQTQPGIPPAPEAEPEVQQPEIQPQVPPAAPEDPGPEPEVPPEEGSQTPETSPPETPDTPPSGEVPPTEETPPPATEVPPVEETPVYSVITALEEVSLPALKLIQSPLYDTRPLSAALAELQTVTATVLRPGGAEEVITLKVDWTASTAEEVPTDVTTVGAYLETAAILLPDETYVFAEAVPATLALPVEVVVPEEPYLITAFDDPSAFFEARAVESGTSVEALLSTLPRIWDCYEDSGAPHLTSLTWDTSALDLETPGLYTIRATVAPPMHGAFAQDVTPPVLEAAVSVQAPGEPDINYCYPTITAWHFPWAVAEKSLEKVLVWLSADGGAWVTAGHEGGVTWDASGLTLHPQVLTSGVTYRLLVEFVGCETGTLTFTYDGTLTIEDYDTSDRGEGLEDPKFSQEDEAPLSPGMEEEAPSESKPAIRPDVPDEPVPVTPAAPPGQSSGPPALSEEEVLGADLLLMVSEGPAEFSRDRMTALFSRESIWDLDVQEEDIFSVLLKDEGENSFSIAVTRNGEFVEAFRDTQVMVPFEAQAADPVLILLNEDGYPVTEGAYDAEKGQATFTIDQTGRYTIVEQESPSTAPPVSEPGEPTPPPEQPPVQEEPASPLPPLHIPLGLLALVIVVAALVLLKARKTTPV